jgi:Kdo2-lipid IVA lauroyltransferase/acyltransferase
VERLAVWVFSAFAKTLSLLSLEGQRRAGRWLGWLVWHLRTQEVRSTLINLRMCFPDMNPRALESLARASLVETGQLLAETGATFHWREHDWQKLIQHVEGEDLLSADPQDTRSLLILVPHFGNWEFLALYLGKRGITALYDRPRVRALEPLILAARSRSGANLLPIDARGLRSFFRAFQAQQPVALLPDQVPERQAGVYAPFFGVPALTMTFAHRLISRCETRVLMGSAMRCKGGFSIRFWAVPDAVADLDPVVSATAMNRAIETLVMTDPAQYQWDYKRFKRPPPGKPYPYPRH